MKSPGYALPIVLALLGFTFILATYVAPTPGSVDAGATSLIDRLVGVSRSALSQKFIDDADRFFHRGVGRLRPRALTNLYEKLSLQISPKAHAHGEPDDIQEIIPWLRFATQVDPHNIDAFLTAAYWLANAGEHAAAEEVLREALRNNPQDFRVYEGKGRYEFRYGKYDRAARSFDASLRLWRPDPDDDYTYFHVAHIMSSRGIVYELNDQYDEAVALYKRIVEMMPPEIDCSMLLGRIEALEKGDRASAWNVQRIDEAFGRRNASHMMDFATDAGDHHDHDHEHDDHDHATCEHEGHNH